MNSFKGVILLVAVLAIISCTPPGDETESLTLKSEAALDGYVTWDFDVTYSGSAAGTSANIGDLASDSGFTVAVVSFDLSTLPTSADIQSATLRMYQNSYMYGDSYGAVGSVIVDNIHYTAFVADANLFAGDTTGTDIGIGPLSTIFSADTWHTLDVTPSAKFELSAYHNGRLQFRIYHHDDTNHDSSDDKDGWVMGDDNVNQPELVIVYK